MTSGLKSPQSRTGLIGDQYVYSASVGTLTTANRPPRCSAGRGTHILYSTGLKYYCTVLCCTSDSCTSSKQYVELVLSASRGEKTKKREYGVGILGICMLGEGTGFVLAKSIRTSWKKRQLSGRICREQAAWLGA